MDPIRWSRCCRSRRRRSSRCTALTARRRHRSHRRAGRPTAPAARSVCMAASVIRPPGVRRSSRPLIGCGSGGRCRSAKGDVRTGRTQGSPESLPKSGRFRVFAIERRDRCEQSQVTIASKSAGSSRSSWSPSWPLVGLGLDHLDERLRRPSGSTMRRPPHPSRRSGSGPAGTRRSAADRPGARSPAPVPA